MNDRRQDGWKYRRNTVFAALFFIAVEIIYMTLFGKDDALRKTIADGLLNTGMWLILGYTLGAVLDDHLKRGGFANFGHKDDSAGRGIPSDSDCDHMDKPHPPQPSQ